MTSQQALAIEDKKAESAVRKGYALATKCGFRKKNFDRKKE